MTDKWKISGTYFEACNCDVACPCTFLSAPTNGECNALVGWHIEKGDLAGITLDGLNVALAVHAPGHMLEVKWKAAIYLDDNASAEQNDALTKIFTGQVGGHPAILVSFVGEVLGIKSAPIAFEANGKQRKLKIAGQAEVEIEGIQDQTGADVSINNPLLGIAPGFVIAVAKSTNMTYSDYGFQWEISGKNGFYSPFIYQAN